MDRATVTRRVSGQTRARSGPPQRRDPRGPGAAAAAGARRRRDLDRLPRYWFANRLVLILSGRQPVHCMLGHTLGAAYDELVRLAPLAPLCPPGDSSPHPAPVVRRCDEYRPRPGVIEAFARILSGDRLHALAFRLEHGRDGRWRCSALELAVPGPRVREQ